MNLRIAKYAINVHLPSTITFLYLINLTYIVLKMYPLLNICIA